MARRNATLVEAYEAVIELLKGEFALDDSTCMPTATPDPPMVPPSVPKCGFFLTVAPGPMLWDETGLIVGGGDQQCTIEMGVYVTACTKVWLDRENDDSAMLLDGGRGQLTAISRITKAMVSNADLTLADGETFLREYIKPRGAARPQTGTIVTPTDRPDEGIPVAWTTLEFVLTFDTDLT